MKFSFARSARINLQDMRRAAKRLHPYLRKLHAAARDRAYGSPESSMFLARDERLVDEVLRTAKRAASKKPKYVIVVGIGGSNLGTKAVYDATRGFFDVLEPARFPKILFADTTHPEFLVRLNALLRRHRPEEILVNVISKSGGTTETVVNADVIVGELGKRSKKTSERVVVTTDHGSKLWNLAERLGMERLAVPERVGGRFSVLSAVGLFPLAAAGMDIAALRAGAAKMIDGCLGDSVVTNPALASALVQWSHWKRGRGIHDLFFFNPELESLGKWVRQLVGESLGKERDLDGDRVNAGITPTVSIGSTDLHSVGQLYLGGPKDKLTTFVRFPQDPSVKTPKRGTFPLVSGVHGIPVASATDAIQRGVKRAYEKKGLPYMDIELPDGSPKSLGSFLQFKMIEVMLLGQLMNVNAFDQPNVELYKQETRRILEA